LQIVVKGKASGNITNLDIATDELEHNLMLWLRRNNITIASSCDGEGICRKCAIQNQWLTCRLTLKEFLKSQPDGIVEVDYL
jgi:Na+-transporting NADH:ubiquinone oxidoreductase subunit NqrF